MIVYPRSSSFKDDLVPVHHIAFQEWVNRTVFINATESNKSMDPRKKKLRC